MSVLHEYSITFIAVENHLRLADGQHPWEGRVEVFVQGKWGTVDGRYWDSQDGDVVCRQLGYSDNGKSLIINTIIYVAKVC